MWEMDLKRHSQRLGGQAGGRPLKGDREVIKWRGRTARRNIAGKLLERWGSRRGRRENWCGFLRLATGGCSHVTSSLLNCEFNASSQIL